MATKAAQDASPTQVMELWERLNNARAKIAAIDPDEIEVGATPKDEIARDGTVTLYRYRPLVDKPLGIPVIYAYALVGRYNVADLSPDRSLIRRLLEQGLDVYAIDWGHPRPVDCHVGLEDYILGYIDDFVDIVRERSPRHREGQPAGHLPGRHLPHHLRLAFPGKGQFGGHHGGAVRLPRQRR